MLSRSLDNKLIIIVDLQLIVIIRGVRAVIQKE